jgi:hypothetical protein
MTSAENLSEEHAARPASLSLVERVVGYDQSHSQRSYLWRGIALVVLTWIAIGDGLTTFILLERGHAEANPVMGQVVNLSPLVACALRVFMGCAIAFIFLLLYTAVWDKTLQRRLTDGLLIIVLLWWSAVLINNITYL